MDCKGRTYPQSEALGGIHLTACGPVNSCTGGETTLAHPLTPPTWFPGHQLCEGFFPVWRSKLSFLDYHRVEGQLGPWE